MLDKVCTFLYTCRCILVFCCSSPWEPFSRITPLPSVTLNCQLVILEGAPDHRCLSTSTHSQAVLVGIVIRQRWFHTNLVGEIKKVTGHREQVECHRLHSPKSPFSSSVCVFFVSALTLGGEPSSEDV